MGSSTRFFIAYFGSNPVVELESTRKKEEEMKLN